MDHFDVVVVGSGSSGGVVASRLSEDSACRVLLLEAGPDFPEEETRPPLFLSGGERSWIPPGIPELDWDYESQPLPNGRRVRLPRGRLVGGSSMVNATVAVRGADFDFERWASLGNAGWSWQDVLPYFIKLERDLDFGQEFYHGSDGPIAVRRWAPRTWTPVHEPFLEACYELGLAETADLNAPGADVAVAGPWPHNRLDEVRLGTLPTYLRAARMRPNFELRDRALVDRALIDGTRAVGVRYIDADGRPQDVGADLVVLAAGAYGTPLILQRTGIGPATELARLGLEPVADLPVGDNLLDHPNCVFEIHAPALADLSGRLFATNARGPLGLGREPEWQLFPLPVSEVRGTAAIVICLNRQEATGRVLITSVDPGAPPFIDHRYLTVENDVLRFAHALEFCRELIATSPFAKRATREVTAGTGARELLLERMSTAHHPAGTCRMGPAGDRSAVVGPDLRVHGFSGLIVADASVFPDNIMNNTNLTCFMVGELAADRIRAGAATAGTAAHASEDAKA